ncbi:MAG: DNA-3-methyladenine glycosylase [Phycisphaerales bacterium]|nr:DNA-3-methyladenine glycosylase [Phycisphaerales bacterium]
MAERFLDYARDPQTLARNLLGQRLVRLHDGVRVAGLIVEAEAYLGITDRAAHTYGGRRTARNESMYLPGGHAYVYFVYGMHHCVNVVGGTRDDPVAVLLRALEPTEGVASMQTRRPRADRLRDLCSGPAKLAQALAVDRDLDGLDLRTDRRLWIERTRRGPLPKALLGRSARIGVDYAGVWARRKLRFYVRGNPHVSRTPSPRRG